MLNISNRVSRLREHLKLTQEEFAAKIGFSRNYISMVENGKKAGKGFQSVVLTLEREHGLMSEQELANNTARGALKVAREKAGLTIQQLAKLTRYRADVLQAVEEGRGSASEKMIEAICRELPGVEKDELMGGSDSPNVISEDGVRGTYGARPNLVMPEGSKARYVPLLSWAQAGSLNAGHVDDGYSYEGILSIDIDDPRAFAVEIKGESMTPRIGSGDKAIVCPSREPRAGDTVIARTLDGDVMCKLFQSKNGGALIILSSWNPAFPPIEIPREQIAWIYPVKQVVQNY